MVRGERGREDLAYPALLGGGGCQALSWEADQWSKVVGGGRVSISIVVATSRIPSRTIIDTSQSISIPMPFHMEVLIAVRLRTRWLSIGCGYRSITREGLLELERIDGELKRFTGDIRERDRLEKLKTVEIEEVFEEN